MKYVLLVAVATMLEFGAMAQLQIKAEDAKEHIGEVVTLCGKIYSGRYLQNANNQPTLLNLGGDFPKQLVTIAIFEVDRKNFPFKPEEYYPKTDVCVTGKIIEYRGMPEIVVQSSEQIKLQLNPASDNNSSQAKTNSTDGTNTTKPKSVPVSGQSSGDEYDVTLSTDVHLRSGPGLEFDPITVLGGGSIVTILKSNNGWSYVSVKKKTGTTDKTENGYIKNSVLK